ncbi:AP-1 complex subunit mu-1 [Thecamonas trahens ATCC 50062]|uniref:AP-1 complex subunit mu-1 n=1 Tax=Thecamonas trahens ATCC 50062 TaxID=461836 RepID=A0A0L0DQK3_THETB|nr:AP-1 complex subunit mu-1 [Thecamonas trahens ATCC 50062]KNC53708.1 AP-1 complex subunit mu-1 [Thecamonas trahens ATCC 50062]|eukprot:XP_013762022.1 AP-1 complex subunit mu-1 [Thecamonas trahens ATCC 50062]
MSCVDAFMLKVLEMEADEAVVPVFELSGVSYLFVSLSSLYLLAVTRKNSNAAMIMTFLHRFANVLTEYFNEVEEESIRDNFVVTYELLDEVMDFGLPQTTDSNILKEYIFEEGHKLSKKGKAASSKQVTVPMTVTNAVSWRSEGIVYRRNEVFLDVVESLNLLVSATGTVLRSEIVGSVQMRTYLSGMPELRLGLNDRTLYEAVGAGASRKSVEMEDIKFHQCVRLSRFERDRTISFIPPDGEFELMSYRMQTSAKPLIWITPIVERHKGSRVEYMIKVTPQFKARSMANNVVIRIPVPADSDSPKIKTSNGSAKYAPQDDMIVWTIKQLRATDGECFLRAHFGLSSLASEESDAKPPIQLEFEIPFQTLSGVVVRYMKVLEASAGYQALPWVRYLTRSGSVEFRTK